MCGTLCLPQQAGRNRNTPFPLLQHPSDSMNASRAVDPTPGPEAAPRERTYEPKECTAMQELRLLSATLRLLAVASYPADPADDIKPPAGYRHWFHVNTMIIDKGSPLFADLGGMHNVYVNSA